MYPVSLKAQNFCSFEDVFYEFQDGLILVEGANGVGKSVFFSDLLCWILFDCTPRGIRFDDVIMKGKHACIGGLVLNDPPSTISRSRIRGKGSVVTVNGNRITQRELEDLLGIDYTTFTASVIHAQMFQGFAERPESEQKVILTKLMGLEIYDECKKVVDSQLTKLDKDLVYFESIKELIKEQLQSLLKKDYVALSKEFEAKRQSEINLINTKIEDLEKKAKECVYTEDTQDELGKLLLDYDTHAEKVKHITEKLEEANLEVNVRTGEAKSLTSSQTNLTQETENIKQMKGPCPTCGQEITEDSIDACLGVIDVEFREISKKLNDLVKEISEKVEYRDNLRKIQQEAKEIEKGKIQDIEKVQEILRNLTTKKQMIQVYEGMLIDKKAELERVKLWENPYTKMVTESEKEIQTLKDRLKESDSSSTELNVTKKYYQFWSEGFSNRGIKSFIFDSLVPEFTFKTNKYLNLLTEKNISVIFDTQREKKTGGLAEKFTIKIADDVGERPYQAWSGGERKRISTAIDISMSDMVLLRSRVNWDFMVFDECFDSLDEEGKEMMLYMLQEIMRERKRVYIISHDNTISGLIDNRVLITKENGISRLNYG